MQHVEKLNRKSIDHILEGRKTAEVVFTKEEKPPLDSMSEEDEIYFQSKEGYAVAMANVTKVEEFKDLTPEKAIEILETHKGVILPTLLNQERDIYFKYATLFWFKNVREIKPFYIVSTNGSNGWIQTKDIEDLMKNGR